MSQKSIRNIAINQQANFLSGTLSVNNTYAEVALATNLTPSGQLGYRLLDIEVGGQATANPPFSLAAALAPSIKFQLHQLSGLGALEFGDRRNLAESIIFAPQFLTTSGVSLTLMEFPHEVPLLSEQLVVTPFLYFGAVTNNANLTGAISVRVYYEPVKLSEVEILRILNG